MVDPTKNPESKITLYIVFIGNPFNYLISFCMLNLSIVFVIKYIFWSISVFN